VKKEHKIKCPNCGVEIDVSEILYHQLHEEIQREFEAKLAVREKDIASRLEEVRKERDSLQQEKERLQEVIAREVKQKLKAERSTLEKRLREEIEQEKTSQIEELQKELEIKSNQVKELNRAKAEIERLNREKEELRDQITLEKEKELTEKLNEQKLKIKKQIEEEQYFTIKEKEKIINDLKEQLEEAKRKAEQGSVQLQGEILELEIENLLRGLYPFDDIEEIKKGQRGADVLQTVRTQQGLVCGKIYYESKRTKDFHHAWLKKLKDDNLTVKADILVLVSEAMPEEINGFGLIDGVWVSSFKELKGLSLVLRHGLIQVHHVTMTQQDKGTKMELLYNYLTSPEFKGQFEAIIEGFKSLQDSYHDEKLKIQKIWKEREKQLEKILTNAVNFYGSLKGIAGASIPHIKMLEKSEE
jgi:hypothetical protein